LSKEGDRYKKNGKNNTYPTFTNVATIIAEEVKSTAAMGLKRICSFRSTKLQVFITLKAKLSNTFNSLGSLKERKKTNFFLSIDKSNRNEGYTPRKYIITNTTFKSGFQFKKKELDFFFFFKKIIGKKVFFF